jgi:hypothetical protein
VNGWGNARFGRIEDNFVAFEVMCNACACPTCFARLEAVTDRLANSDTKWTVQDLYIPERGGASSAVLVIEPKEIPEKIDVFLSGLLGLQISEAA